MFVALERFHVRFGHANVRRSFRTDEGERLGAWLHRQRSLFAAGTLSAKRMQLLERVGVRWSMADRSAGIAAFAAFQAAEGHGLVPQTFRTEDGFPLGTWVQSRRRQWSRGAADAERLWPELVALGFVWVVRDDAAAWAAGVTALDQYRRDYGDVLVPHWFVAADGLQLGRWVDSRRVDYRSGALPADRVRALEVLGMVWRLRQPPDDRARRRREQMLQQSPRRRRRPFVWRSGQHGRSLRCAHGIGRARHRSGKRTIRRRCLFVLLLYGLEHIEALVRPTSLLLGFVLIAAVISRIMDAFHELHAPASRRIRTVLLFLSAVVAVLMGFAALATAGRVLLLFVLEVGLFFLVIGLIEIFFALHDRVRRAYVDASFVESAAHVGRRGELLDRPLRHGPSLPVRRP